MRLLTLLMMFLMATPLAQAQLEGPMIFVDQLKARATKGKNGAVYMNILNNETDEWNLVAAESDVCDRVELHTHIQEGDVFRMRPIDEVSLNPGTVVQLKPGGMHVMLMGLKQELKAGDTVQLILKFKSNAGQEFALEVSAPVVKGKCGCCAHKQKKSGNCHGK